MKRDMAQLSIAPGAVGGRPSFGRRVALVALVATVLTGSCGDAPPLGDYYNRVTVLTVGPQAISRNGLVVGAVDAVNSADFEILAAFGHLQSATMAAALISAQRRGVDVKVVGDVDNADEAGMQRLLSELRPGPAGDVPVHLGDGEIRYNPALIDTVTRDGDMNRMTHSFMVIDRGRTLNISGGFLTKTTDQIGFDVISEDVAKDFADEFTQMYGGVFATTLDTYNGPLKSMSDNRDHYLTSTSDMELYFGPQERSIKKVIDEVYAAKASVALVTSEFTNAPLLQALRYKAEAGFSVRVAVGSEGVGADHTRMDSLVEFLGTERVSVGDGIAVSAVIIDAERSPIDGERYRGRAMVLSQPLTSSLSFIPRDSGPDPRTADAFMDSNMWVINRYPSSDLNTDFEAIAARVDGIIERAEPACAPHGCGTGRCVDGVCVEEGQ